MVPCAVVSHFLECTISHTSTWEDLLGVILSGKEILQRSSVVLFHFITLSKCQNCREHIWFSRAAVINDHKLGNLKQQKLSLSLCGKPESEIKVSVSVRSLCHPNRVGCRCAPQPMVAASRRCTVALQKTPSPLLPICSCLFSVSFWLKYSAASLHRLILVPEW